MDEELSEKELVPPGDFKFPFVPYDIQKDFMRNLYQAIEQKKIGIFESPTGTGKSMSIICGTLTWLQDNDKRIRDRVGGILSQDKENNKPRSLSNKGGKSVTPDSRDEPDWIREFIQKQGERDEQKEAKAVDKKLKLRDAKMKRILDGIDDESSDEPQRKRRKYVKDEAHDETTRLMEQARRELELHDKKLSGVEVDEADQDIVLEEYYSDDETKKHVEESEDEDMEDNGVQKIYYCSRTHSQLTQFIREIQKSPFAVKADQADVITHISVVPLASRQSLCINESVRRLQSTQQINDRCLDMQKNSKKKSEEDEVSSRKKSRKTSAACPYLKSQRNVDRLSDTILGKVQDIEEIVKAGKAGEACPYYAARNSVPIAQVVVVPYQILLHSSTRKASGIKLKNSVVVVDEAHNLVDTISNIHSIEVTCSQVLRAHNQLSQYAKKFSKRLKAKNLMYVKQILYILSKLLSAMGLTSAHSTASAEQSASSHQPHNSGTAVESKSNAIPGKDDMKTTLMTIHDFLFKANMDNINLFKVLRYCERSMISRKLNGFVEKYDGLPKTVETTPLAKFLSAANQTQEIKAVSETGDSSTTMRSPLMHIESFLSSLTSANEDGRVAVTAPGAAGANPAKIRESASIKYLLLNPATHFKDLVDECRSLIVAGGTMQPSSSFVNQLLTPAGVAKSRIFEFSCGHVIQKDQLLPVVLSNGPSGSELEFTFSKRNNLKLIDDLGRLLFNLCNVVPGGIVCFFPSYDYEKMVYTRWQQTEVTSKIGIKKKIFREPKKTSHVDAILGEYSACIRRSKPQNATTTGALLLSVVGGKMSEGINFSDDLGRCVVMVGLPYPNMYSAELKEKMAYLDSHMPRVGTKSAGQSYYENLCMKAVNQSIGRAIRHRNDHACIVLADKRYSRPNVMSQLPGWIADKTFTAKNFGHAFGEVRKFFTSKKDGA